MTGRGAASVGLIGSRRKVATVAARAAEAGLSEADLAALRAPIGLPIGAETPEEIAVSIAAEIIAVRRGAMAADALRVTRRICAQPALAPYAPEEWRPRARWQSAEALARAAGELGTTIFHPVGTPRLGRDGDPPAGLAPPMRPRGRSSAPPRVS